jgi:long-chain acyl-CoA synthetase|tara:strand:+ start:198 stop:1736 length:1539 start_codon:yes stop_codon:yes gene_type:complete
MLTLTSALCRAAATYRDKLAIIDPEGQFTWAEFVDRIARAASVLQSLGVERGDRFGIICRNSFRNAELMYAGYWMGAVPVPINYRLAPIEIADILTDAGCKTVAVELYFEALLGADALKPWAASPLWITPLATPIEGQSYEALLSAAVPVPVYAAAEDDEAVLQYTGGTTGRSKGVRLSHKNVISNGLQVASTVHPRSSDILLHVCPMFHSSDLLATAFTLAGAAHVYLPEFSGDGLFAAIEKHHVTFVIMVPGMVVMALKGADISRYDLSSLRALWYGGSPLAIEWIVKALDAFQVADIFQCYGQTEASPAATLLLTADHLEGVETGNREILGSAGRLLPGIDMRIVDSEDCEVAPGEPGEIVIRGPNVSRGYLNRPAETVAVFRDGWYYTGDIGRIDDRGYLHVFDRKQDMVITGGENVYSSEVEAALSKHPKVLECAVTGVPDEAYGEALLAAIVTGPGETVEEEELIAHCRDLIGGYKIPRRYVFLDELPRSTLHKVLKHELRNIYGG